jgi:hypothetical protein
MVKREEPEILIEGLPETNLPPGYLNMKTATGAKHVRAKRD